VRFGLSLPHYGFSLPNGDPITFEACAEWARRAEGLGFHSAWVSDHFFYSFQRYGENSGPIAALEPLTTLAGLAQETSTIRLGTLVLGAPFRHPSVLAKSLVSLDRLSGGRLEVGLGAGWFEEEFDAFGYGFGSVGDRFAALEASLAVLSTLSSTNERVDLEAGGVVLKEARLVPAPIQQPIPLWVGGKGGPRLLRLAARYAAGWNVVWRMSPTSYEGKLASVADACAAEGRNPATLRRTVGLYALVGVDEAEARAAFERGRAAMPGGAMDGQTYESWRADTLSGTPEQCMSRVREFARLGVEEIIIAPWVLPFAIQEPAQIELFAERVLAPLQRS
jgi:alkanesulfonate monooxygenase SsuD/methylene tetrahydromethanopterin reductase-like flavin-dependent oxidoreductase (luciferase family)